MFFNKTLKAGLKSREMKCLSRFDRHQQSKRQTSGYNIAPSSSITLSVLNKWFEVASLDNFALHSCSLKLKSNISQLSEKGYVPFETGQVSVERQVSPLQLEMMGLCYGHKAGIVDLHIMIRSFVAQEHDLLKLSCTPTTENG